MIFLLRKPWKPANIRDFEGRREVFLHGVSEIGRASCRERV